VINYYLLLFVQIVGSSTV